MLNEKLVLLRKQAHISQQRLSELLGISRQAVAKWESGSSKPDVDNLTRISEIFKVSIDSLLGQSRNSPDEIRLNISIKPKYESMHEWEAYFSQLGIDFEQCLDEGRDVEHMRGLVGEISKLPADEYKKKMADVLFGMMLNAPIRSDFSYDEPDNIEMIDRLCSFDVPQPKRLPNSETMLDKLLGAFMGRAAGCLLGKPIECIKTDELTMFLKETDNYPMRRYITTADANEQRIKRYKYEFWCKAYPDAIDCAPVDDDTNYSVLSSCIIKKHGREFTSVDVAREWIELQGKNAYCTAERVAYCNFIRGFEPPTSAKYQNPYREWIGAQIRTDYYGYINPGDVRTAADMAYRDACISHTKNGIYAARFVAAMLAHAAVCQNVSEIITAGMTVVPRTSRLYQALGEIMSMHAKGISCDNCFAFIHRKFNEYNPHHWCHSISNAMVTAAALLYGEGDFSKSICLAVQTGFDTDCNGATVGSVLGMMLGAARLPDRWTRPLAGVQDTSIFGVGKISFEKLAQTALEHAQIK